MTAIDSRQSHSRLLLHRLCDEGGLGLPLPTTHVDGTEARLINAHDFTLVDEEGDYELTHDAPLGIKEGGVVAEVGTVEHAVAQLVLLPQYLAKCARARHESQLLLLNSTAKSSQRDVRHSHILDNLGNCI